MGKRILLSLMILSLIFLFVFCTPTTEEPTVKIVYDVTPPTLVSVSAEYVEGGEGNGEVKIQIEAVDDLTFVKNVNCIIGSPTKTVLADSYDYTDKKTVSDFNQNGNIWTATYPMSKFSENGIWTIDNIQIADRGNKTRIYYLDPLPAYTGKYTERFISTSNPTDFNAVTIERQNTFLTGTLDITAPDLTIPSGSADLNVSVDFDNDEPDFIQNVEVELISPKIRNNEKGLVIIKNLTWNGIDRWSSPITFYSYNQSGSWLIRKITITDTDPTPKIITYYTNDYSGTASQYSYFLNDSGAVYTTGFNKKSVAITTGSSDALNPDLTGISADKLDITSSGEITNITVNYNDANSGIYSVKINMIANDDEDDLKTETLTGLTPGATSCVIPFEFVLNETNGLWKITSIILTDYAGNYREYFIKYFSSLPSGYYYGYNDSLLEGVEDSRTNIELIKISVLIEN